MAARTTTGAGNVSNSALTDGGILNGGTPLGLTDTLTVSHAIVMVPGTIFGHSPPSDDATPALTVATGGSVSITGGVVKCRGDYSLTSHGTGIILGASGIFEFDASQASSPTSQHYKARPTQYDSTLFQANAASWEIRSNAAGGNAHITSVDDFLARGALIDLIGGASIGTRGTITRMGRSDKPAFFGGPWSIFGSLSGLTYRLKHVKFIDCGTVNLGFIDDTMNVIVSDVVMTGTIGGLTLVSQSTGYTTGTRTVEGLSLETGVSFAYVSVGFTLDNSVIGFFYNPDLATYTFARPPSGIFVIHNPDIIVFPSATKLAGIVLGAVDNPHTLSLPSGGTWDQCYFEAPRATLTGDTGDWFTWSGPSTVNKAIVVPVANGAQSGAVPFQNVDAAGLTLTNSVICCTKCSGAVELGEQSAGNANDITSCKGNIFWGTPSGGSAYAMAYTTQGPASPSDQCPAAAFDYNMLDSRLTTGSNGPGINKMTLSAGSYQVHGQTKTPTFKVPGGGNLQKWGLTHGTDGTPEAAADLLRSDPLTYIPDFWTYQLDAWLCTDAEAHGTGPSGTDMGVGYVAAGGTDHGARMRRLLRP